MEISYIMDFVYIPGMTGRHLIINILTLKNLQQKKRSKWNALYIILKIYYLIPIFSRKPAGIAALFTLILSVLSSI